MGSSSLSFSSLLSSTEWRDERGMVEKEKEGEGRGSGGRLPLPRLLSPEAASHPVPVAVETFLPPDSSLASLFPAASAHIWRSRVGDEGDDGAEDVCEGFLALRLASRKLARGGRRRTPLRVEPSMAFCS